MENCRNELKMGLKREFEVGDKDHTSLEIGEREERGSKRAWAKSFQLREKGRNWASSKKDEGEERINIWVDSRLEDRKRSCDEEWSKGDGKSSGELGRKMGRRFEKRSDAEK